MAIPPILSGENVLLIAETGTGKCVGKDTLVLTENGPIEIGNLYKKLIKVNTIDENLKTSIKDGIIIQKKKSRLYEVVTTAGRRIKVTDDHKFLTIKNGNLLWSPLKNLKLNDYVAISRKQNLIENEPKITFDMFLPFLNTRICFKIDPSVKEILEILKKNGYSINKIARLINCHKATLNRAKKGCMINGNLIKKLIELADIKLESIRIKEIGFPRSKKVRIPQIDENFAYFVGLIIGDGNINQDRNIRFTTASDKLLKLFSSYINNIGLEIKKDSSSKYDYYVASKSLLYLLYSIGLPRKNKSANVKIPNIFFSRYSLLSSVLRGIYDTDGSIYDNTIELTTKSGKLSDEILIGLSCLGIVGIRKIKRIKGLNYQRIVIQNVIDRITFNNTISFFNPEKKVRLLNSLHNKSNPNIDIIPEISLLVRKLVNLIRVNISKSEDIGLYKSYIKSDYHNPTRNGLLRILNYISKNSQIDRLTEQFIFLYNLASSDIFWDRIKEIRELYDDYVYDATIPETKNFIGNGIILHNTESCMLPIFNLILTKNPKPISVLYLTPLKSLNRDLMDRMLWWSNQLDIEISVRHGDTTQHERKLQVEFPPHIMFCTLETLQPILVGKNIRELLRNVKWIVLDEVHECVDSKRGVQLSLALERLKELCGNFQLIMLSATVAHPEKVAGFFSGGSEVKVIKADTVKKMEINVINPKTFPEDKKVAEKIFSSDETAARLRVIMELIEKSRSTLTFTNTREFAEILASRINTLNKDFPVAIHHSSLSKDVRIKAEKDFKEEKLKSIIATSSLQLGIDIGSVDQVIQYQSPRQISQLIQRIGRSGHEMSRISKGTIISTEDDDIFESAVIAKRALSGELEEIRFHELCLDVLAHQIIGLTFDFGRIQLEKAYEIVKRAEPYKKLSYTEFLEVCKQLERLGLAFIDTDIKKRMRGFEYYFSQLSTIPDTKNYKVFNSLDNSFVGVVDEEFVALHGEANTTFIIKGSTWRIISVEGDKVLVEPTEDIEAAIPGWEGELIPVPFEVAQEVGQVRGLIKNLLLKKKSEKEISSELMKKYPIDNNCAKEMIDIIKKQKDVPDGKTIIIEYSDDLAVIHTCFGTLVNETLGRYLTSLLTSRIGSVALKTDPYRIILQFQKKNIELLKEVLFETKPEYFRTYLEISLGKSELFEWKFVHVAKRFGAISRGAELGKVRIKRIVEDYVGTPIYKETMRELETEKLDIDRTEEIIKKIQKKEIPVVFRTGLSNLGKIGIKHKYAEVVGPEKPELEIFEMFKKRLLNTKMRLICTNCGEWEQTYFVKEMPEDIKCKKCGARSLSPLKHKLIGAIKLVKKALKETPLTTEEKKNFERLKELSDLYLVYRTKIAKVLAGRGVGPQTAKRILTKYHKTEDDLLRDILNAEREFIKNKKYWKV